MVTMSQMPRLDFSVHNEFSINNSESVDSIEEVSIFSHYACKYYLQ